jgi:hypothetical protein
MSLPIKSTPILTGKSSKLFQELIKNPKPVSQEDYNRAKKLYI